MAELMTIATTLGSIAWYAIRLHYASRVQTCRVAGGEKATGKQHDILTCFVASQGLEPRA
jgi:hypothetical protein